MKERANRFITPIQSEVSDTTTLRIRREGSLRTASTTTITVELLMPVKVWIGLANVKARVGNEALEGNSRAFVNALAVAEDPADYRKKVTGALIKMGFDVLEIDEDEPLANRLRKYVVDPQLRELAAEAERSGEVTFGNFHSYEDDVE